MHLKNGIITSENTDGRIGVVIEEHLKNRFEQDSHSNSFGLNFGAMLSFGVTQGLINGMMAVPVDRKVSSSSVHESYAQSGMYVKENHIEIGEKIEIKPELENHEHLKVRDTAPISSIGSIMAGVQEVKENWEEIHKPQYHDIIIDAEPVEVVQEHKEEKKPVIAVDADPKTPDSQAVKEPDYTIHEQEARQLLDEIYYEDIAPYHEFERAGSPDRVETELTKVLTGVIDHANELEKRVNCYTKAVFQVVGYVSDAFSVPLKPVNEYVISPALDALDTQVRRTLRDDCRFSQGFAQDAGDMSSIIAGLLIPCRIAKIPCKITKLKVHDRVAQRKVGNVGKFNDLIEGRPFHDGKEVHHFPAQKYLKANNLDANEALSIVLTKGQHAKTRTFRSKAQNIDLNSTYRDELARDIKDVKRILKEDGTWNAEIRQSLLKGLDNFRKEYPQLFEKAKK